MSEVALVHRAHHVAGAIYGTILATTVVAAAGHEPETIDQAAILVLGTSVVFWLAHVYSLGLAARVVARRPLRRDEMVSLAIAEWPMLQSSWPILLALMLGVTGIVPRATAVDLAMAVGIGALFTYGFVIGRQEKLSWPKVLLNMAISGAFGLAILALKVFVH
ncbi:hypothetical protein [Pengzhenrongella frigida]|uniref:Integral membrane protein n=1 Tax=Pengzhenrongella frigida TaxID=1259133 RepID=A0A4Q5MZ28_9MICO|nr:hypothetical protein [Cellulomonas sp. HLT2-17]RYV50936.1 hypothetical protein EUA98_11165 [Cellulomonas sp. HLT2-17]